MHRNNQMIIKFLKVSTIENEIKSKSVKHNPFHTWFVGGLDFGKEILKMNIGNMSRTIPKAHTKMMYYPIWLTPVSV